MGVVMDAWLDTAIRVATFVGVVVSIYVSLRNSTKIKTVASDVLLIEKATNSMKDALVHATGAAAKAEGKEEARIEGEQKASILATAQLAATAAAAVGNQTVKTQTVGTQIVEKKP